jgi:hypothetical protein
MSLANVELIVFDEFDRLFDSSKGKFVGQVSVADRAKQQKIIRMHVKKGYRCVGCMQIADKTHGLVLGQCTTSIVVLITKTLLSFFFSPHTTGDASGGGRESREHRDASARTNLNYVSLIYALFAVCASTLRALTFVLRNQVRVMIGPQNVALSSVAQSFVYCGDESGKLLAMRNVTTTPATAIDRTHGDQFFSPKKQHIRIVRSTVRIRCRILAS